MTTETQEETMGAALRPKKSEASRCGSCGMTTNLGAAEYHPYAFCVLKRGGLNPWEVVRDLQRDLGLRQTESPQAFNAHLSRILR